MADNDAMEYFLSQGRRPSFDSRGNVRGARSRPRAPQATASGTLSAVGWMDKFNNVGQGVRNAATAELGRAPTIPVTGGPATTANVFRGNPDGDTTIPGIAAQTLDTAFGPGHWSKLVGRGPVAAPALLPPAGNWQGPAQPSRPVSAYADAHYQTPFGKASVNFAGAMNRQPKLPASTGNWWNRTG